MSTPEMIWRPTGIGSARLVVAVVVALVATFIGPTAATASTLTAVAEVVVVDVGDVGALPYSCDHRADFARPPPVEDASRHYDTAKPVNLVEALGRARRLLSGLDADRVAPNTAGVVDDLAAGARFRSDTSHVFRDAPGHLARDTVANRSLLQGAVRPKNLVGTRGPGGSISVYREVLPDGRQVWVEVRNGAEITNGGVNTVPR